MEHLKRILAQNLSKKLNTRPVFIEFRDFFLSENIFDKFGVNFFKSPLHPSKFQKWKNIHFNIAKCSTFVIIFLSLINFIISITTGSFITAIESSAAAGIFSLMILKIYIIMMKNRETIADIISTLEVHFPTDGWNQYVFKVPKYLKTLKIFRGITLTVYGTIFFEMIASPYIEQVYGWMTSSCISLEPFMKFYVPFNFQHYLGFAVLYIFQVWIFCINVLVLFSEELLYFGLVIVLSMEFNILGQVMTEIDARDDQNEAVEELKKLIKVHQELIEITEKLRDIFSLILFVNIFSMIYLICGTAFLSFVSNFFPFD